MRIEVMFQDQVETIPLPPDTDLVGISLGMGTMVNINNSLPKTLGGAPVECKTEQKQLANGKQLSIYLYRFDGKAKVLSLKKYPGLVHCDVQYGELRMKVIV